MCSCRHQARRCDADAANRGSHSEPNPRLIMAVVAVGVIIGALFSPARQSQVNVASTQPAPAKAIDPR